LFPRLLTLGVALVFWAAEPAAASDATDAARQGHAAYAKKKFREAASYFELALTYDPTRAEYHYWASMSHSGAMEDPEAYEWIRSALSLDDTDGRYHAQHGRVCQFLGNPGEAAMAFGKALAMAPDDAETWAAYGMVLKQSGHPYQAMEAYHKALELRPELPGVAFDLGQSLMELKDPEQAVGMFRRAVATDPRCLDCFLDLGDALMATGDPGGALTAYADAHRLAADDWRPPQRSIQACYTLADYAAADLHKRTLQKLYTQGKVYALAGLKGYVVEEFEVGDLTVKAYEYFDGEAPEGVRWTFLACDPTGWQEARMDVRDAVSVASGGRSVRRGLGMELVETREGQTPEMLSSWNQAVSYPTVRTTVIEWLRGR